jgi:uncharacterized protein YkwD
MNLVRVQPLIEDTTLNMRAQARAEYLCANNQWSHNAWLNSFNGIPYNYAGENLARGFMNPVDEFNALMRSQTHRQNIVSPLYTKVGIGHACGIDVTLFQG